MTLPPNYANLPPQLWGLSARAPDLHDAVKDALQATLSVAARDATPEQVLADTFTRLGYLPEEARRATMKVMVGVTR